MTSLLYRVFRVPALVRLAKVLAFAALAAAAQAALDNLGLLDIPTSILPVIMAGLMALEKWAKMPSASQ